MSDSGNQTTGSPVVLLPPSLIDGGNLSSLSTLACRLAAGHYFIPTIKLIEGKYRECVVVDTIAPNSPFVLGGLLEGDVVLSVKDHDVTDAKEAFRLLSKAGEKGKSEFKWGQKQERQQPIEATQRVQLETTAGPQTSNANDDSSRSKTGLFTSRTSLANLLGGTTKTKKIGDSEDIFNKAKQKGFPIKRTTYVLSTREPVFLETFEFEIKNNYKYINVGIWSKGQIISMRGTKKPRQDTMLAYTSIPVTHVLEECQKTTEGYHGQVVKLLCPEFQQLPKEFIKYATQSGFDPRLCYGDITLRFLYKGEYKVKGATQEQGQHVRIMADPSVDIMGLESIGSSNETQVVKALNHEFQDVSFKKIITCKLCNARTSIPVTHVLEECQKTTEGYHGQVVKLLCPEFQQLPNACKITTMAEEAQTGVTVCSPPATPATTPPTVKNRQRHPPLFAGTPDSDVHNWLKTYERASLHDRWDDSFKLASVFSSSKTPL
ncbi:PDZ domain-containing protein 8 [Ixodes scapularis]